MDDVVCSHYHHPDSVGVLSQLAADGRAYDHVQATVAAPSVTVIMTGENRLHPCSEEGQRGSGEWYGTLNLQ